MRDLIQNCILRDFLHLHLETFEDLPFSVRGSEYFPFSAWPETTKTHFSQGISAGNLPFELKHRSVKNWSEWIKKAWMNKEV